MIDSSLILKVDARTRVNDWQALKLLSLPASGRGFARHTYRMARFFSWFSGASILFSPRFLAWRLVVFFLDF